LTSTLALAACSNDSLFGAPAGAGGASSTSTGSTATSTSDGPSQTGSSQGGSSQSSSTVQGGAGPGPGGIGMGGEGPGGKGTGGSPSCNHKICDTGDPLAPGCDPCVAQICQQDPFCCNQLWDNICVGLVGAICQIDCFPIGTGPCGMQYPSNPVCSDDNNACALAYNATLGSCAAVCAAGGGECLQAYNDVQNLTCIVAQNEPVSCLSQLYASAVCLCSLGCGNGPACTVGQICINGNCI
jgi:hypothetical protein